jgi:hypothetical protein
MRIVAAELENAGRLIADLRRRSLGVIAVRRHAVE